jgi:hypothetical protein
MYPHCALRSCACFACADARARAAAQPPKATAHATDSARAVALKATPDAPDSARAVAPNHAASTRCVGAGSHKSMVATGPGRRPVKRGAAGARPRSNLNASLHESYAVMVGLHALGAVPTAYRDAVAAQMLPALGARRWWEHAMIAAPVPFARRLSMHFPAWSEGSSRISAGFLFNGHRVSCELRRVATERVAELSRLALVPEKTVDLEGDRVASPDTVGAEQLSDYEPDARPGLIPYNVDEFQYDENETVGSRRHATKKPGAEKRREMESLWGLSVAAINRSFLAGGPRDLVIASDESLEPAASMPDASLLIPIELRFTVERPSSVGALDLGDFESTHFWPGTPVSVPPRLLQYTLSPPGTFMSEFFYRIEDDLLPEPWATIEGDLTISSPQHLLGFDQPLVMWIRANSLDKPLTLPVSVFGCSITHSVRFPRISSK